MQRRWGALAVLAGAVALLAVDGTVLYLAVPSLTQELGATATQVLWIGDIYSLVLAGLLVTMGTLGDRIGRKKLLLTGTTAFGAASLLAAFAPTAELLILARLLLGVAGATIMPSTLSIIRNLFTEPQERRRAIAIWSAASGGGLALGPLVGGVLLENFWWGSVFLINVPIALALLAAGLVLLPESRDPAPGQFDIISSALSMITIVPLVYSVKHLVTSGVDQTAAMAVVVGVVAGVLFVRRQHRLSAPMIDVGLFRTPAFTGAVLADIIAIFALTGLLFFFSQYLQLVRGFSPMLAGLAELPTTIASIVVVAVVTMLAGRLGMARSIALGLGVAAVGLVLVAVAEGADRYLWLGLALIPVGLGVGLAMTLTTDAIVSAVPKNKAGAASAVSETAYELGVALGIAVLGSVVNVLYRHHLVLPAGLPDGMRTAVEESLASALQVAGGDLALADAAREAFTGAMQTTSLIAAVITAVAGVVAWRTIRSDSNGSIDRNGSADRGVGSDECHAPLAAATTTPAGCSSTPPRPSSATVA